ncbi:MobF family relaxase [Streptomyces yaizuensis]|uniref:TrwC relaxase domain-containing protein n=1 Tax=Streptomyces yaizuensis TaxID=2989713 RepID=A0ABQ5PBX0_9ACTN|nr:MobF family relaxase [Streptomyces sp. YSPA8]GLF99876.1 hypothetical protein SYYSPA8_36285 [Streptomyces sp. YSPA8]
MSRESSQASLLVLWVLGDDRARVVIERAHARAVARVLEWLEGEVAEIRWSSGRKRARLPGLVVAAFRHWDNRDNSPLLHEHLLILNRAQRADGVWYALDTRRLYQHAVAAGTLYTLAMTTEVCEELGLATVPREVTPGLRPVMEIAGVDAEVIEWKSTRRQRIEDAVETIIDQYVKEHGRLPDERARHGLGWWAAQDTRPDKKTPKTSEAAAGVVARVRAPPRSATRYERGKVASLALQNAIRTARTAPPPVRDGAPATTTPPAHTDDHHHHHGDRAAADPPHAVDHPCRGGALTPTQRAAAIHAHQQAAMPKEYA